MSRWASKYYQKNAYQEYIKRSYCFMIHSLSILFDSSFLYKIWKVNDSEMIEMLSQHRNHILFQVYLLHNIGMSLLKLMDIRSNERSGDNNIEYHMYKMSSDVKWCWVTTSSPCWAQNLTLPFTSYLRKKNWVLCKMQYDLYSISSS